MFVGLRADELINRVKAIVLSLEVHKKQSNKQTHNLSHVKKTWRQLNRDPALLPLMLNKHLSEGFTV